MISVCRASCIYTWPAKITKWQTVSERETLNEYFNRSQNKSESEHSARESRADDAKALPPADDVAASADLLLSQARNEMVQPRSKDPSCGAGRGTLRQTFRLHCKKLSCLLRKADQFFYLIRWSKEILLGQHWFKFTLFGTERLCPKRWSSAYLIQSSYRRWSSGHLIGYKAGLQCGEANFIP